MIWKQTRIQRASRSNAVGQSTMGPALPIGQQRPSRCGCRDGADLECQPVEAVAPWTVQARGWVTAAVAAGILSTCEWPVCTSCSWHDTSCRCAAWSNGWGCICSTQFHGTLLCPASAGVATPSITSSVLSVKLYVVAACAGACPMAAAAAPVLIPQPLMYGNAAVLKDLRTLRQQEKLFGSEEPAAALVSRLKVSPPDITRGQGDA